MLLFAVVLGMFFHESLFQNHSLVPTDILHQFILPREAGARPIKVQNHYPIDEVIQSYPAGKFWHESVRNGEWPLWNPYVLGGHPQLATSIWGVLCPSNLLKLLFGNERGHTYGMVLQFFLAGVFMMAFLRELGQSAWAAFLGGCAYALNSQFMLLFWMWLNVFAWVPLAMLLLERALSGPSRGYALAAGCVMAVPLVSGSIQMSFFVGFLCGFYALASLWWRPREQRREALGQIGIVFGVAFLAGAVQFLPTLEFLGWEAGGRIWNSDSGDMAGFRHIVLGIPALITFVFPALAGSPETFDLLRLFKGAMVYYSGYIGLIPFLMFVIGAQVRGEKRRRTWLLLIGAVMAIVFFTPLLRYVYHRFFMVAVFGMAVLAGYGFDALLQRTEENLKIFRRSFTWLLIAGGMLMGGLLAVQWYVQGHYARLLETAQRYLQQQSEVSYYSEFPEYLLGRVPGFLVHFRMTNPLFWVPVAGLVVAYFCWGAYARQRISRNVFAGLVLLLALSDLAWMGRSWVPQVDLAQYPLDPPVPVLAPAQSDPELFRVARLLPGKSMTLMENVLTAYGLSSATGYESLFPENLDNLVSESNGQFNALLDLKNVKYILTKASTELPVERFTPVADGPGVRLYRNKSCLPRLQLVRSWQVERDRARILALMGTPGFDARAKVFLEQEPSPQALAGVETTVDASTPEVTMRKYSAQRITATVRASQGGIALLADTWYPGWKARLDGKKVPLYRADYVLKGVYVPPGTHEIEYYFAPATFRIGAAISLVTILGCGVFGLGKWIRGRTNFARRSIVLPKIR